MKKLTWLLLVFAAAAVTLALSPDRPLVSAGDKPSTQMTANNAGSMQDMGMHQKKDVQAEEAQDKKVRDPVCSMMVDPEKAEKSVYKGKTYHFCSKEDKAAFEESPEKYLKRRGMRHMGMGSDMPMCCKGKMGRKAPTETQEDTREPGMESMEAQGTARKQTAKIAVMETGFEPSTITLKPNVPARLTFVRQTDKTCATSVAIPEYKINRDLPLDKPVVVEFTPKSTGEFTFACGMGMLKGKLVVEESNPDREKN